MEPAPPRRQQRRKNRKAVGAEDTRSIHDVPDDLLHLILLCLDSPIWVMRAASACKRWHRVVTDGADDEGRAFLRLASSLHPPTVVGQYHNKGRRNNRFLPSSTSPIIDTSRFSVEFLVKNSRWHVADCYGGLVLLSMAFASCPRSESDLVVYDPLTRQHRLISRRPAPDKNQLNGIYDLLLLHADEGKISISNFRVLTQLNVAASNPTVSVFSTANGGGWDRRFERQSVDGDIFRYCYCHGYMTAGRANDGTLYLVFRMNRGLGSKIITLDSTSLVLSMFQLPTRMLDTSSFRLSTLTTVAHGAGVLDPSSPPTTSLVHVHGEVLELFRKVHGSGEWVLEHSIPNLSVATHGLSICLEKEEFLEWMTMVDIIVDGSTFAILSSRRSNSLDDFINNRRWWFSFNVNTMELQVLQQELYRDTREIFNYTLPWPQSLRACPCS